MFSQCSLDSFVDELDHLVIQQNPSEIKEQRVLGRDAVEGTWKDFAIINISRSRSVS